MYNPGFFERLCPVLSDTIPGFDERKFINKVFDNQWPDLELKQRTRQITLALRCFMPDDFILAAPMIVNLSNRLRQNEEQEQSYPLIFLPDYIAVYGLDHFEISMMALGEVTKLVSAEFAVRPFLMRYPETAMQQMIAWSTHENSFVRRLASEGCRPRLPWAMGLPALKIDPSPIWPVLENLKEDTSEYVRRSVANNLNDIAKDHPETLLKKVRRWKADHPSTKWIIKHGCRTLLKKGSEEALIMHGFDPAIKSDVTAMKLQRKVHIGDQLQFQFTFCNRERKPDHFRLEYRIGYITSAGKVSSKIFKIGEYRLQPGQSLVVKKKQSFKDLTTRKHYKGMHALNIVVNGKVKASKTFVVS